MSNIYTVNPGLRMVGAAAPARKLQGFRLFHALTSFSQLVILQLVQKPPCHDAKGGNFNSSFFKASIVEGESLAAGLTRRAS